MSENVRVLVLKQTKLGESDSIVTTLKSDGSLVSGIAKGVRKSGSRFGAAFEPYTVCEVHTYPRPSLDLFTEAKIVTSNEGCRLDIERSAAAAVIAATLLKVAQEGQTEERIFDLSASALDHLCSAVREYLPLLVSAYLFKLLAMVGYRPSLDVCAVCGRTEPEFSRFSHRGGGVVCSQCLGAVVTEAIEPANVSWISYLIRARFGEIETEDIAPETGVELLYLARAWVSEHVGSKIKALEFFITLAPAH